SSPSWQLASQESGKSWISSGTESRRRWPSWAAPQSRRSTQHMFSCRRAGLNPQRDDPLRSQQDLSIIWPRSRSNVVTVAVDMTGVEAIAFDAYGTLFDIAGDTWAAPEVVATMREKQL